MWNAGWPTSQSASFQIRGFFVPVAGRSEIGQRVAAGVAILLTAVVGLSVGAALLWRKQDRTKRQYERAEREHKLAERNFETARTTILEMGKRIDAIETGLANARSSDLKRRDALNAARKEFESYLAENPNNLVLKKQLASLHRYAGNISRLLSDYREAHNAYKASIALWEELIEQEPDIATHRDNLAQTLGDLATTQKLGGRLKEAAKSLDRAAELAEKFKDHVRESSYERTLATNLLDRADVEYRLGDFVAAERAAHRVRTL